MHLDAATDQAMLAAAGWQIAVGVIALVVSVVSIILAGKSIRIARDTVRDQRENRDYPSDRAAADEFAAELRRIPFDGDLVDDAPDALSIRFDRFNTAMLEFVEVVSDSSGLLMYFNRRREEIRQLCEQADDPTDPMAKSARRLGINAKMTAVHRMVRYWPYPERRPGLQDEIVKYLNIGPDGRPR